VFFSPSSIHQLQEFRKAHQLQEFRKATAEDPEMQKLKEYSIKGWPTEKRTVHKDVQKYWTHKEEISYTSGQTCS